MHGKIVLPALAMAAMFFIVTWFGIKYRKRVSYLEIVVYALIGFQWLFFAGYIAIEMYNKEINENHMKIIEELVQPLLTIVPMFYVVCYIFAIRLINRINSMG